MGDGRAARPIPGVCVQCLWRCTARSRYRAYNGSTVGAQFSSGTRQLLEVGRTSRRAMIASDRDRSARLVEHGYNFSSSLASPLMLHLQCNRKGRLMMGKAALAKAHNFVPIWNTGRSRVSEATQLPFHTSAKAGQLLTVHPLFGSDHIDVPQSECIKFAGIRLSLKLLQNTAANAHFAHIGLCDSTNCLTSIAPCFPDPSHCAVTTVEPRRFSTYRQTPVSGELVFKMASVATPPPAARPPASASQQKKDTECQTSPRTQTPPPTAKPRGVPCHCRC
eukprot:IDg13300t1